jgi:hypothetical protein
MNAYKLLAATAVAASIAGCRAAPVNPNAELVKLTNTEPGKECQLLGEVRGHQGNMVTGEVEPNFNLETGARNDIKNKAAAMNGNVVYIVSMRNTPAGTSVTIDGRAYRCRD